MSSAVRSLRISSGLVTPAGVAQLVKADEAFGPLGVAMFGARQIQAKTERAAQPIEQLRRLRKGHIAAGLMEDLVIEEGKSVTGLFERG
jgi:hypothetical protein